MTRRPAAQCLNNRMPKERAEAGPQLQDMRTLTKLLASGQAPKAAARSAGDSSSTTTTTSALLVCRESAMSVDRNSWTSWAVRQKTGNTTARQGSAGPWPQELVLPRTIPAASGKWFLKVSKVLDTASEDLSRHFIKGCRPLLLAKLARPRYPPMVPTIFKRTNVRVQYMDLGTLSQWSGFAQKTAPRRVSRQVGGRAMSSGLELDKALLGTRLVLPCAHRPRVAWSVTRVGQVCRWWQPCFRNILTLSHRAEGPVTAFATRPWLNREGSMLKVCLS
mmetsp:Transcript_11697/g.41783  ORF Transcript_11697/g.41783 Transcript_11697/m.41783 type:complete len:277 (+) Transcript_11697:855-1685(+)